MPAINWRGHVDLGVDFDLHTAGPSDLFSHARQYRRTFDKLLENGEAAGATEYGIVLRAIGSSPRQSVRYEFGDGQPTDEEDEEEEDEDEDKEEEDIEEEMEEDGMTAVVEGEQASEEVENEDEDGMQHA